MSKELTVLNNIPSYALSTAGAAAFEDLLGGISAGAPPSIRIKNGKFRLVVGGEETVIPPSKLKESEFLPVVILGAKKALNKTYYAEAYSPEDEPAAPDCWSLDGIAPDASIKNPVCSSCASCPMNAFGSGKNAKGEPTKGKACTDTKILAVGYSGGVYQMRIPPASLKGFGAFVRMLQQRNVPPGNVITYVGIDDTADFPMLTFQPGAFVPEEILPRLAELAGGPEVYDIVHPSFSGVAAPESTKAAAKKAAPAVESEEEDDEGEDELAAAKAAAEAEAAAKKKKAAADKKKKAAAAAAAATAADEEEEEDAEEATTTPKSGIPSDDELDSILGF